MCICLFTLHVYISIYLYIYVCVYIYIYIYIIYIYIYIHTYIYILGQHEAAMKNLLQVGQNIDTLDMHISRKIDRKIDILMHR